MTFLANTIASADCLIYSMSSAISVAAGEGGEISAGQGRQVWLVHLADSSLRNLQYKQVIAAVFQFPH